MRPRSLAFWLSQMRMTWQQRFSNSHYSPFPPCKRSRARTWEIDRGGGIFTHFQIRHHDHTTKTEAAIQLRGPNLRSSFPFSFSISWSKTNASSLRPRGKKTHPPSHIWAKKIHILVDLSRICPSRKKRKTSLFSFFLLAFKAAMSMRRRRKLSPSKQAGLILLFCHAGHPPPSSAQPFFFLSRRMNTQEIKK